MWFLVRVRWKAEEWRLRNWHWTALFNWRPQAGLFSLTNHSIIVDQNVNELFRIFLIWEFLRYGMRNKLLSRKTAYIKQIIWCIGGFLEEDVGTKVLKLYVISFTSAIPVLTDKLNAIKQTQNFWWKSLMPERHAIGWYFNKCGDAT